MIYLVHYTKPMTQPEAYEVVAYAPGDGSSRVVMDPDEPGEQMNGMPLSRVTSADGNIEFTLYNNPEEPFIHQLNVADGTAECIDLPQLKGAELAGATLKLDGGTVAIGDLAKLDPETQAVTLTAREPVAAVSTPRATATATPTPPAGRRVLAVAVRGRSGWSRSARVALLVSRRRSAQEVEDVHVTVHHADEHAGPA